ncbi:related to SAF1 - protein involved in proteasome-dependent degradation [Ustilago sp. UG-2017b]|nr:related to SAF1 - protein involved in proteasome-dependent degradation [Ustilago sp. UG-2017b]
MASTTPLDLPLPLLLDLIFPLLPTSTLLALRLVSTGLKTVVEDQVLWKRKVLSDFTFPLYATARMGGWFNLYRGLSCPDVYVWGQLSEGRLGLKVDELGVEVRRDALACRGGLPYPYKLDTLGVSNASNPRASGRIAREAGRVGQVGGIVEIVAGGWSFHARTSSGKVLHWGTMDGECFAGNQSSLRDAGKQVSTPRLLSGIPDQVQSLSGGRSHAVALTKEGRVVEWRSWGSLWLHDSLPSSLLPSSTSHATMPAPQASETGAQTSAARSGIKQLEAGWSFTSILDEQGNVWLWYSDWTEDKFREQYYGGYEQAAIMFADPPGRNSQTLFSVSITPLQLPPLPTSAPTRPDQQEQEQEQEQITQIAAGEDFLIALTSHGHLFRLHLHLPATNLGEEQEVARQEQQARPGDFDQSRNTGALVHRLKMQRYLQTRAQWQRLPLFEEPDKLPGFDKGWVRDGRSKIGRVSHISAHFRRFVAFLPVHSSSKVMGKGEEGEDTLVLLGTPDTIEPELIPELQARKVIKVTMGDYHYGALTSQGEILTWGEFSKGALGNWSPTWVRNSANTLQNQEQEDEGERGWLSNLIALPTILGNRGTARQARIGFAGRGGRATASNNARREHQQGRLRGGTQEHMERPGTISIHPEPTLDGGEDGGGGGKRGKRGGEPFAFDIAFAGWHSSALVMYAPSPGGLGTEDEEREEEANEDEDEDEDEDDVFQDAE